MNTSDSRQRIHFFESPTAHHYCSELQKKKRAEVWLTYDAEINFRPFEIN